GIDLFKGTAFYTNNTISRYQMMRPFPQFNGVLQEKGRNEGKLWYDSLQVTYNLRFRAGVTVMGNYTWSKQLEQWGYNDPFTDTLQKSVYFLDRPHVLKFSTVWELPFGQGKHFLG